MRTSGGGGAAVGFSWPKPGRVLIAIIAINTVAYVLFLVALRAEAPFASKLAMVPAHVIEKGYVWQPFTYIILHSPKAPFHLIMNMLILYWFGATLESWWGSKRFAMAYVIFGLSGAALTLLVGALSKIDVLFPLLTSVYNKPHIGASGAVSGIMLAFALVNINQTLHFFILGQVKGKTFLYIIIAYELLVALSFDNVSSTSHFGGMIGAFVLLKGLWKPGSWSKMFKKAQLQRKKKKIEHELRLIQGGKDDDDPKNWN